jgi:2-dehydropantoate 2-reductase
VRQEPFSYLLVGSGRLAKHFAYYFKSKGMSLRTWSRSTHSIEQLNSSVKEASHILLAISDDQIEKFISQHLQNYKHKIIVHFSGALSITNLLCEKNDSEIIGAHPLMSFSYELYDLKDYEKIPFIFDSKVNENEIGLSKIFPLLSNPFHYLESNKKALYHALCVVGGNFTNILWATVEKEFVSSLKLSPDVLAEYKQRVFRNNLLDSKGTLTGPFIRQDLATIEKHTQALEKVGLAQLYTSMFQVYEQINQAHIAKETN